MDIFDLGQFRQDMVFPGAEADHTLRRSFAESVSVRPSDT